jgi:hypothetical protein
LTWLSGLSAVFPTFQILIALRYICDASDCDSSMFLRPPEPGRFAVAFDHQRRIGKLLPPTLLGTTVSFKHWIVCTVMVRQAEGAFGR